MKHHKSNRKLGRERNVRNALLKSLARSVLLHERIQTTLAKAKEVQPEVEKLITKSKNDTLGSRRLVVSKLGDIKLTGKLFKALAEKYKDRNGGYTRVIKMPRRVSDNSPMAIIELV
jgi:large subunit ribosomal protein L17